MKCKRVSLVWARLALIRRSVVVLMRDREPMRLLSRPLSGGMTVGPASHPVCPLFGAARSLRRVLLASVPSPGRVGQVVAGFGGLNTVFQRRPNS